MTLGERNVLRGEGQHVASVTFDRVSKVYDNGFKAVDALDLQIQDGKVELYRCKVKLSFKYEKGSD